MTKAGKKIDASRMESLKNKREQWIHDVRKGRGVSVDFFRRHGWLVIFFTVAILVLIGMRYRTKVYMRQIKELRMELKQAENERLSEKAKYMSMIREKDMVELAAQHSLGLEFAETPPFELVLEEEDSLKNN